MKLRALSLLALAACAAPAILGGPTAETTTHSCPQGGSCPNGFDCPPLGFPTEPCQSSGAGPTNWGGEGTDSPMMAKRKVPCPAHYDAGSACTPLLLPDAGR